MMSDNIEYAYERDGYVSVWYGCFPVEADFIDYLTTTYTEDGEAVSTFLSEFPFLDFDEDFSERYFFQDIAEGIHEVSYIASFSADLLADFHTLSEESTNALFFIYDCDAEALINKSATMKLLGVYEYETDHENWRTIVIS